MGKKDANKVNEYYKYPKGFKRKSLMELYGEEEYKKGLKIAMEADKRLEAQEKEEAENKDENLDANDTDK